MQGGAAAAAKRPKPSCLEGLGTPLPTRFSITPKGAQPWISPTLFRRSGSPPAIRNPCDRGVPDLSGWPHHDFDLSLFRRFGLGFSKEDEKLQTRWKLFNAFNAPQFQPRHVSSLASGYLLERDESGRSLRPSEPIRYRRVTLRKSASPIWEKAATA